MYPILVLQNRWKVHFNALFKRENVYTAMSTQTFTGDNNPVVFALAGRTLH